MHKLSMMHFYHFREADNDEDETVREIVETNIQDFKYEAYAIKKEDGSIDLPNFCINWKKYAVVDLDDDGINELVYYVYQGGEGFYIIFHVINGIVYGYSEMYRNIYYLYKDGTIEGASGASYFWFERIESFEPTAMNIHVVASHNDDFCSIKNQNVTENDFYDFISKWRSDDGNTQVN